MRFCLILYNILRNASIVGQHRYGVDAKGRGGVDSGKSERKEAESHG